MPFAKHADPHQVVTYISLRALGVAGSRGRVRLEELAGQALPAGFDFEQVGLVLATRDEVETLGFMEEFNVGVAVSFVAHKALHVPQEGEQQWHIRENECARVVGGRALGSSPHRLALHRGGVL